METKTKTKPKPKVGTNAIGKCKKNVTGEVKRAEDICCENHVKRIDGIEVIFKRNAKHDSEEFTRQLKQQEEGMNSLTVEEYMKNRARYIAKGRSKEGNALQKAVRQNAYAEKVIELREKGCSPVKAEEEAKKWMNTKAALHGPDQVAGGNPEKIDGIGDAAINSSLGSQWKYRINEVDEKIAKAAEKMTEAERKNTYLNIKLRE